ncbi:MAG: Rrf2 family transcriptional regulator [Candidatus Caldatribacteriota bacterium]|nr:Rrf2 family transcriptional regulator [Candidatus Caldatribacteriota bacterium]
MKLITRNTDYAIRALCCIAESKKELLSADQLVKSLDMPRPFLRKILQILNKEGLLNSSKGKGGGFALTVSPGKITLIDLMKIFQGPIKLNECTFKKKVCPNVKDCLLKKKIDEIEKEVILRLKAITLESLLIK